MAKKFYLTTAIGYVNASPHLGHAMQFVRADVLARYHRLKRSDVFFLTGTDEYGSKIFKTAREQGILPQELVDRNALEFKELDKSLNISYDAFIRTTDKKKHWPGARKMWLAMVKAGDIYKKKYKGLYCVGCEAYKTEKDLINGKCPEHLTEPETVEEENYFFRLSKYAKAIESKIKKNELMIIPLARKNEALAFLKQDIEDISFSRPKRNLPWGISTPDDDSQVIYVWADALTNYISALGFGGKNPKNFKKFWPADLHIIGKDNLKFHVLYWPAMLLSAKLPLPQKIYVHGFITSGGQKMSKSLGNVVNPFDLIKKYGNEAVRYYLLREIPAYEDGDFSEEKFIFRYNGELANGLGNFCARILTLAGKTPLIAEKMRLNPAIAKEIKQIKKQVNDELEEFKFNEALAAIWKLISFGDNYINKTEPWKIKDEKHKAEIIFNLIGLLKNVALLLEPFLPETSGKIIKSVKHSGKIIKVSKGENLFPRIS